MLLKDVFNAGPRRYPDKIGVVDGARRFSYRELGRRWNRLANALLELGMYTGDCLCVLMKNSLEVIDANAAAVKIGAVIATLNYRLDSGAIEALLMDTRCPVLMVDLEFSKMIAGMRSRLPCLRACIVVGGEAKDMLDYEALIQSQPSQEPAVDLSGTGPAVINYTSGTTGVPKGALATRQTVALRLCHAAMELSLTPMDRYLVVLPMVHIGANMPALAAIFQCATLVVQREWDPREFCRLVQDEGVTKAILTPGLLGFVLDFDSVGDYDLSSFKRLQYGGSPMAVATMKRAMALMPACKFQQGYGTSETFTQCLLRFEDHAAAIAGSPEAGQRLTSVGKEASLCRIRVVREDGTEVTAGEIGEIILGGPMLMREYVNNPAETAARLRDGWFYTGDLATLDADGYVYLVDRKNRMIITGGENVYPAQVEAVLSTHPQITAAAVLGVPDETWGEAVKAVVVVARAGEPLTQAAVIDFCRGKMATYAKPKSVDFVDQLPHLVTGKLDYLTLKQRYA